MALTREELLLAADVAEKYPKGFGIKYGYGPLYGVRHDDIEEHLREYPDHASFG